MNSYYKTLCLVLVTGCSSVTAQNLPSLPRVQPPSFDRTYYETSDVPEASVLPLTNNAPDARVTPLNQGQTAPYNGVLFNGPAVASIQVQYHSEQERCLVERRSDQLRVGARAIADLERMQSEFIANEQTYRVVLDGRDREIQRLNNIPHYNPWLLTGVGILGGLSLFGLIYAVVH